MEFSDIKRGMTVRVKTFEQFKEYYVVTNNPPKVKASSWYKPQWVIPVDNTTIIDIKRANELI